MSRNYSSAALAKKLGAIFACVIAAACADKAFHPVFNASSKIQLQFNAVGAQQVNAAGKRQVLVVAAAYKSTVLTQETDSFRILAGPLVVQVTGATQSVTLNVDITGCLADPTRMGSQTGCTVWYGVWLHDSATFSADTSDGFDKHAYDYSFLSVDVAPGKAPVVPAINLSTTRYSIFEFDGDESLRLGGPLSQAQFNGPMTGTVTGLAAGALHVDEHVHVREPHQLRERIQRRAARDLSERSMDACLRAAGRPAVQRCRGILAERRLSRGAGRDLSLRRHVDLVRRRHRHRKCRVDWRSHLGHFEIRGCRNVRGQCVVRQHDELDEKSGFDERCRD
jgi:hypothetical protein